MSVARYIIGDVRDVLRTVPDGSVDLIVTSPPFLALRSYLPADHPWKAREIGSESTPAGFLDVLLELTVEWRRVLAPHGSIAVELGDTYAGSGGGGGDYLDGGLREGQQQFAGSGSSMRESNAAHWRAKNANRSAWPLDKSLAGIPSLYAWSLAYGRNLLNPEHTIEPWRIRNLLVWARPNPPVGALGDKWRPATSFVTVACTGRSRYFDLDAVREPHKRSEVERASTAHRAKGGGRGPWALKDADARHMATGQAFYNEGNPAGAPPLDWLDERDIDWQPLMPLPTQPYAGSHYATFPSQLPARLIECMAPRRVCTTCGTPSTRITSEPQYVSTNGGRVVNHWAGERRGDAVNQWDVKGGNPGHAVRSVETLGWSDCGHGDTWRPGVVLDPFAGSGTTLAAATGAGRDAIGIDLDERNADLARERVGMFLEVERHEGVRA